MLQEMGVRLIQQKGLKYVAKVEDTEAHSLPIQTSESVAKLRSKIEGNFSFWLGIWHKNGCDKPLGLHADGIFMEEIKSCLVDVLTDKWN